MVQAIHLPTLARLTDRFTVRHIMDVDPDVAAAAASRVGAAHSTTVEELLADEAVEVVAICSPSQFHAVQVIAAMRAGKRAVLCEKPFATTRAEAEEIAAVSEQTGVPVIVGAMHTFDPGWTQAAAAWGDLPEKAHTIRSSIVLPPNPRYEDLATEVQGRVPMRPPHGPITPEVRAGAVRGGVLGLAIHDLPLIRVFLPAFADVEVHSAERLAPFGYGITFTAGDRNVLLAASMHQQWKPRWELEVIADDQSLHIDFTPSYVHAGSAISTLRAADGSARRFGPFGFNGYEGEWQAMHRVATGDLTAVPPLATLIDDLTFAVDIAEKAATALLAEETAA
ncbi:hypothetical protein GCM10027416_19670 [Okibacterium endophyticum]